MTDDLLLIAGLVLSAALCGWFVVHAISGVVLLVPADDLCGTAAQCVALVVGQ